MSKYKETVTPLRRRIILEFLAESKDGHSNADILVSVINGTRDGVTAYYSDVVEDIRWLAMKGLITVAGEAMVAVTLTSQGYRIAADEDREEGIARPRPKA